MATSIQKICDRAVQIAENIGGKFTLDEPTAELLLPHVLKKIFLDARTDAAKIKSLTVTSTLTFANGEADMPVGARLEFEDYLTLENPDAEEAEEISYLRDAYDFNRSLPKLFSYFTVKSGKVLYKQAQEDAGVFSGDRDFSAVTKPEIPATATADWNISEDFAEDLAIELARALRGEPPYMNLGEESEEE